jgi:hypothetical protein
VLAALRQVVVAVARSRARAWPGTEVQSGWTTELVAMAGRGVPVTGPSGYAAALTQLAATENCPLSWSAELQRAADIIALRRAFAEETR